MTNKIVILQNSVELYEHYIDDERWERTLAFPRGGLTYNISNGTIKFFAFEDYLYRNCLMSMQLPIYIIDDETGTEGEYSDIDDIIDILDSIFPTNGNGEGQDLSQYLKKREAEELYQPIGDYVTTYELDEVLDDYYTKDETDNLLDDKLDITAYTPFDPSNYYTKIEVDNKIASGGSFDPDQYYNKSQSDTRFALKDEIPSLSGYATEEWVTSRNYATRADFITYINNMQTQINSLIESVSGCCGTQEDVYRWLTLISQYICENHDKYEKQQYQVSHDGGIVWENVEPAQYRKGQLLEADSEDCGYAPDPQYRWKAAPTSDYLCIGTSKYYKVYYEVSYDNGQTWQHVQPEQTKRGDLIQAKSPDCGYIEPKYRWYTSQSEYICSGTTKYEKQYYQVSYDNGSTWQNVTPLQTRTGAVIEYQSTDCGYVPSLGKYRLVLNDSTVVNGACGSSSSVTNAEVSSYTSTVVSVEIGSCVNKISIGAFDHSSNLSSITFSNSVRVIDYAAFAYCSGLTSVALPNGLTSFGQDAFSHCTSLTSVTIPNSVTSINNGVFYGCVSLKDIVIPNSVTSIGIGTFQNCTGLKTVTIGSGTTSINNRAFMNCSSLSSITCNAITPPTLGVDVFAYTANCPIYVPCQSVAAYKTAWADYSSRIRCETEPQYRWYTSQSEYICSGTTKYQKQYYQVSYDGGNTWQNVTPIQTRTGAVIEYDSEDCGYVPPTPQYRWKDTSSKTCSGYNQHYVAVKQVSYDEGQTWQNVTPIETQLGSLYQAYSYSCGYVGTPKLKLYTDNGDMNQLNCESSTSSTLTCAEYWDVYDNFNGDACSGLHIEIGDCVNTIGDLLYGRMINFSPCAKTIDYGKNVTKVKDDNASAEFCTGLTAVTLPPNITNINFTFRGCTSLRTMTVPSKVTEIGSGVWQNCSSLESLTFLSTTPPDLGDYYSITFQNTNNCILYVPAASLNAYKTANGWREYASRIKAINS